jgi:hypothetical protein
MSATPRPPTKAERKAAEQAAAKAAERAAEIKKEHQRRANQQERHNAKLRAAEELEQQEIAAQRAARQKRVALEFLRLQANAATLAKYTAQYTEEARQILMCLPKKLTTRTLSKLEQPAIVAPLKATIRALCLGLTRLSLRKSTDKLTGMPFTRVDPAVIEEAFLKFTVRDFLQDKDAADAVLMPDAVLITILVDTCNHYILAISSGNDVHFENSPNGYAYQYPNILHIGNGVPGKSPDEIDAFDEEMLMLTN